MLTNAHTHRLRRIGFSLKLATSAIALGAALGAAPTLAQSKVYATGENSAAAIDTTGQVWTLRVDGVSATQSGVISGDSGIIKTGAGRLHLYTANTYSGITRLDEGELFFSSNASFGTSTLEVGAAGELSSTGFVTLANDITLSSLGPDGGRFTTGGELTLAGTISGTGSLVANAVTLIVSGNNTYSGGTYVVGRLVVASDQALGTGAVHMGATSAMTLRDGIVLANEVAIDAATGARIDVGSGTGATLTGALTGSGNFTKSGAGMLRLSGASTFTGEVFVGGGELSINNDAALGTGSVFVGAAATIEDGVTLSNAVRLGGPSAQLSARGTGTIEGDISGTGFAKYGDGTLVLLGDNTYTGRAVVRTGTLAIQGDNSLGAGGVYIDNGATLQFIPTGTNGYYTTGSIAGGGHIDFAGRRLTVGTDNTDTEFSGSFSDFNMLYKAGSGTLTLNASNLSLETDSGATGYIEVQSGGLRVLGEVIDGYVLGRNASVISGTGYIEGLDATDDTVIAPGNAAGAIGTLRLGNLFADGNVVYQVNVNAAGESDLISTTTAGLYGGSVAVSAAAGDYAPSTQYLILTATDGLATVGGEIQKFSGVTSDLFFLDASLTYDPNNVWLTLARNSNTFDQISGITANQKAVAPVVESFGAGNILYDTIVSGTEAEGHGALDSLSGELHAGVGTALTGQSQRVQDVLLSRMRQPFSSLVDGSFAALGYAEDGKSAATAGDWTVTPWTQAFGGFQQFNSNGNASTLKQGTGGVLFGVDGTLDNRFRLGIAGGASGSHLSGDTGPSSADITSYHLAAYGAAELDALALRFGAAYSWNTLNTNRDVAFRSFADQTSAKYGGHTGQVFGEVGYKVAVGQVMLEPFAGLSIVGVGVDSFRESGGVAALNGGGLTQSTSFTTLGLRGNWTISASETGILSLNGGIGWRHAFNANPAVRDLAFNAGGAIFQSAGVPVASDSFVLEAGLDYEATSGLTLGASYAGQIAGSSQSHTLKAGLGFSF